MGIGKATGENKTEEAAKMAISSPLLDTTVEGAKGILVNVTGSSDLGILEVNEAINLIKEAVDPEADIIFGTAVNDDLGEEVVVTVVATGFEKKIKNNDMEFKTPRTDFKSNFNIEEKRTTTDDSNYIDVPVFLQRRR